MGSARMHAGHTVWLFSLFSQVAFRVHQHHTGGLFATSAGPCQTPIGPAGHWRLVATGLAQNRGRCNFERKAGKKREKRRRKRVVGKKSPRATPAVTPAPSILCHSPCSLVLAIPMRSDSRSLEEEAC